MIPSSSDCSLLPPRPLQTPRLLRLSKLLRFFEKLRGASYFKVLELVPLWV